MSRVCIRPSVRREIAEAIVEMASPGFSVEAQGAWYLVDGERVVHRSATAAWSPWPDGATAIRVDQLLADRYEEGVRLYWFDPSPPDGDEDRAHDYWAGAVALADEYLPEWVDIGGDDGDPDPFAPLDPDIPDRVEFPVSYGHLRSLHDLLERMSRGNQGDDVVAGELSGIYDALLMLQAGGGYWDLHPLLLNARVAGMSHRTDYYTARARALELAMRLVSEEESERRPRDD